MKRNIGAELNSTKQECIDHENPLENGWIGFYQSNKFSGANGCEIY